MARSKITSASKDMISDDGSVLVSVIHGEQTRLNLQINWVTNLTGFTILAKIIEGNNIQGSGTKPTAAAVSTPQITTLTVIDTTVTDNLFDLVIPETLIDNWDTYPEVDKPVYGLIGLELRDTGVGTAQQVWKPLRGLVEVLYSPTEVS